MSNVPGKIKRETDWIKVILFLHLNALSIVALYFLPGAMIKTVLFALVLIILGTLGVTAGAHRLWAHKSYKAGTNLRIFLMLCQTLAGQGSIYNWVLKHRIHHKYHGTNLDRFNPTKGFLYSHFLSFMEAPNEVDEQVEMEIDMSDIQADKVVMFQHKYYVLMYIFLFGLLPMNAPAEYWGEQVLASCFIIGWLRYYITLNFAWLVHSGSEVWGLKPGEKYPSDSNIVFFITKSYWPQYHYMVPWDYLTSEYGAYGIDCTSKFIRAMAAIGAAGDLKTVDPEAVREASFKSITGKKTIAECLAELEHCSVEKQYFLKPLNVMM